MRLKRTLRIVGWDFTMHIAIGIGTVYIWKNGWKQVISFEWKSRENARPNDGKANDKDCTLYKALKCRTIEIEWMFWEIDKIKTEAKKGRIQQLFPTISVRPLLLAASSFSTLLNAMRSNNTQLSYAFLFIATIFSYYLFIYVFARLFIS